MKKDINIITQWITDHENMVEWYCVDHSADEWEGPEGYAISASLYPENNSYCYALTLARDIKDSGELPEHMTVDRILGLIYWAVKTGKISENYDILETTADGVKTDVIYYSTR